MSGTSTVEPSAWGTTPVLLLAALPGLAAWTVFGGYEAPDTVGYLAYAEQILHRAVPTGQALLQEAPAPMPPVPRAGLFRVFDVKSFSSTIR